MSIQDEHQLPTQLSVGKRSIESYLTLADTTRDRQVPGTICCLEAYGHLLFVNANALGKSPMANAAFFVRFSLWALVAMAALVLFPPLRTILGAYLDLKAVGVATFYSAFGNAVVALISSSSVAHPLQESAG